MNNQQFEVIHDLMKSLHNKVEHLDEKLDALNVETVKQDMRIKKLEDVDSNRSSFITSITTLAIGAAITLLVNYLGIGSSPARADKQGNTSRTASVSRVNL